MKGLDEFVRPPALGEHTHQFEAKLRDTDTNRFFEFNIC